MPGAVAPPAAGDITPGYSPPAEPAPVQLDVLLRANHVGTWQQAGPHEDPRSHDRKLVAVHASAVRGRRHAISGDNSAVGLHPNVGSGSCDRWLMQPRGPPTGS